MLPGRDLECAGLAARLEEEMYQVIGKIAPERIFEGFLVDHEGAGLLSLLDEPPVGVQRFGAELLVDDPAAVRAMELAIDFPLPDDRARHLEAHGVDLRGLLGQIVGRCKREQAGERVIGPCVQTPSISVRGETVRDFVRGVVLIRPR